MFEFQRARLIRAAVEVASERGYEQMTVTAIVARARVSRKTFYELFENRDDCFLAVFEEALHQMTRVFAPAYEEDGEWPDRLRNALAAVLEFLEHERDLATLALSYLRCGGPRHPERRERALEMLRRVVDDGRRHARHSHKPSPVTSEAVVGGALAVIDARLQSREARLVALVNPLMSTIVLPYLGPGAAARELKRKPPTYRAPARPPAGDPVKKLGIRLTFRTAKALAVIAEQPGRSNVQVSALVGITDQGQTSKLLSRLARLGLIENTGAGSKQGAANAWRLTPSGIEFERAVKGVAPPPGPEGRSATRSPAVLEVSERRSLRPGSPHATVD